MAHDGQVVGVGPECRRPDGRLSERDVAEVGQSEGGSRGAAARHMVIVDKVDTATVACGVIGWVDGCGCCEVTTKAIIVVSGIEVYDETFLS